MPLCVRSHVHKQVLLNMMDKERLINFFLLQIFLFPDRGTYMRIRGFKNSLHSLFFRV